MTSTTQNDLDVSKLLPPIQPDDHPQGGPDAPYVLVEYVDYEAPKAAIAH